MRDHQPHHHAFTLVELLVVIGIVGLLLSLLLPALARARALSRTAACLAQQREILNGSLLSAADSEGFLPLAGWVRVPNYSSGEVAHHLNDSQRRRYAYERVGNPAIQIQERVVSFPVALTPYLADADPEDIRAKMSWREFAKHAPVSVFRCPAEAELSETAYKPAVGLELSNRIFHFYIDDFPLDYALNGALLGFDGERVWSGRRLRGHLTAVSDSSRTLVFADADPWRSAMMAWGPRVDGDGPVTLGHALEAPSQFDEFVGLTARHRDRVNVAFVDGHAESVQTKRDALDDVIISSK